MAILSDYLMNTLLVLQRPLCAYAGARLDESQVAFDCRSTCSGICEGSCAGDCVGDCAGRCENSCSGDYD